MKEIVKPGVDMMNRGEYYEAHEVLEAVWHQPFPQADRQALRALIQVAVGLHHAERGNWTGAAGVLRRALRGLDNVPDDWAGLDVARLRGDVQNLLATEKGLPLVVHSS